MRLPVSLSLLAPVFGLLTACGGGQEQQKPPPPPVSVARPLPRDVVDWDDYTGRFEAAQDVEVRPRINGVISAVHFRDGQDVREGQPLFSIDPSPYRAALLQAEAQVTRARAVLANARQVTARSRQLIAAEAVSREELEANVASERSAAADVAAAAAAAQRARLDLGYTTVRAPFRGRVSDRKVDRGATVGAGQTVLTRVVSVDPIHFAFEGAEAFYIKNLRQDERGERRSSRYAANPIQIQLADEPDYRWHGQMAFLDNAVDPGSGTIRAHAVVPNPTGFLTPGMFGRARLLGSGTYRALLIPDEAVMTDQTRRLVFVVGKDNKTAQRVVELGAKVEGLRIVRAGLAPTELVIVEGIGRLQPGMEVSPKRVAIKPKPEGQPLPTAPLKEPESGQATAR